MHIEMCGGGACRGVVDECPCAYINVECGVNESTNIDMIIIFSAKHNTINTKYTKTRNKIRMKNM